MYFLLGAGASEEGPVGPRRRELEKGEHVAKLAIPELTNLRECDVSGIVRQPRRFSLVRGWLEAPCISGRI